MKRSVKSAFILIFSVIFSFAVYAQEQSDVPAFDERLFDGASFCEFADISDIPEIHGYSAYVYNVETGSVIYRKNQDDPVYPASTAKLMTAIVAYEHIPDLQTVITASKSAVLAAKGSNMAIKTDEQFTAEQLLYGLLVTGANDAANVLAEYVAGDIDAFCTMMNEKAIEIGTVNTKYTNPTGLHSDSMKTTAKDTAIIADYFYGINTLFEMSNTTRYTIDKTPYTNQQRILLNRNLLISRVRSEDYYYSKAMGMSLGSTPEAGDCIVTSASDESGMTYICVVMNAYSSDETNYACIDAAELLKMCLQKFKYSGVLTSKTVICEIPVTLAVDTDYVTLLPQNGISALLPADFNYETDISVEPRISCDYTEAPIYEGDVYGEAVVKYKDTIIIGTVGLCAGRNIEQSNVLNLLNQAEKFFSGKWFRVFSVTAAALLVLYFGISVWFSSKKRGRKRYR